MPASFHLIALDLEGTLISNAVSQIARPGLFEFLEGCQRLADRVVIYSAVPAARAHLILEGLAAEGTMPAWAASLACFDIMPNGFKDLRAIGGCHAEHSVLVDDTPEVIAPDLRHRWVPVPMFQSPYPADDDALWKAQEQLTVLLMDAQT